MSIQFTDILYPTDFSDLAQAAFAFASDFADRFDARLHCLHVVDEAYQYWSAMGPESIPVGPGPDDLMNLALTRMEKYRDERLGSLKHAAVTHVTVGRPFAEIISYAREHEVDMIVMATHGRGAFTHMLLGSTTEKVVRKAGCLVLTVRARNKEFVMP